MEPRAWAVASVIWMVSSLILHLLFFRADLRTLDASVTQSALEEALMSNMQHGGMASRMSTISQALRSRYLQ